MLAGCVEFWYSTHCSESGVVNESGEVKELFALPLPLPNTIEEVRTSGRHSGQNWESKKSNVFYPSISRNLPGTVEWLQISWKWNSLLLRWEFSKSYIYLFIENWTNFIRKLNSAEDLNGSFLQRIQNVHAEFDNTHNASGKP